MATMFWWVLPGKSLCIPNTPTFQQNFLDLQALQSKALSLLLIFPHFFFLYIMFVFFTHCCCCCSVTQLCLTLRDPRLPCPSLSPGVFSNSCPLSWWCHPAISSLSPPSPPAFNGSQNQGLFQWTGSSHQVVKQLELQLQHQSFEWIFGWFPLRLTGLISLLSKELSRVFYSITDWKYKFFGTQPSLWSSFHTPTWLLVKQ